MVGRSSFSFSPSHFLPLDCLRFREFPPPTVREISTLLQLRLPLFPLVATLLFRSRYQDSTSSMVGRFRSFRIRVSLVLSVFQQLEIFSWPTPLVEWRLSFVIV